METLAGDRDKRGVRDAMRLKPQVCFFFVIFYYYTNEYLQINYAMNGDDKGRRGSRRVGLELLGLF
jgi:hypothetical protein